MRTLCLLFVLSLFGTAQAAEPSSGTLTEENTLLEFTGGPFAAANIFGQAGDPECIEPVFPCDHYLITVDLPDDFVQNFPSAIIRMVVAVDSPGGGVREDYDVYLYDENGALVAEAVSENDPEALGILAENGESQFELRIVPFTATGSTYIGTIELIPGEPVNPAAARSLGAARGAGGGLGLAGLLVLLAGLARRRH